MQPSMFRRRTKSSRLPGSGHVPSSWFKKDSVASTPAVAAERLPKSALKRAELEEDDKEEPKTDNGGTNSNGNTRRELFLATNSSGVGGCLRSSPTGLKRANKHRLSDSETSDTEVFRDVNDQSKEKPTSSTSESPLSDSSSSAKSKPGKVAKMKPKSSTKASETVERAENSGQNDRLEVDEDDANQRTKSETVTPPPSSSFLDGSVLTSAASDADAMETDESPKLSADYKSGKKRKASPSRASKNKAAKSTERDDVSKTKDKSHSSADGEPENDESDHESDIDEEEVAQMVSKSGGYDFGSWKTGEKIPYSALCRAFELIEATTKRLEITNILSRFFKSVIETTPECLLECLYLCINRLGAEYRNKELGIGESILTKAVASATGRSGDKIKADMEKMGDLGQVAQASRSNQPVMFKPKPLDVSKVFKSLKEISETSGKESQARKIDKIKLLLVACQGNEPRYLIRSLEGKLRIGLAEQTVLLALASAAVMTDSELSKLKGEKLKEKIAEGAGILKSVYSELPDYDLIVPVLLKHGIMKLEDHCHLIPGIPLKPMLAHPTKSISEVLDRFEGIHFTCEWKYDGERAQIHHLESGETKVYSRNSEDLSKKYPDILERASKIAKEGVKSFVLDCEAVAWDKEEKNILPFQVLSTRKRKDVAVEDLKVQVCIFAFDLLYLNGKPLIKEAFTERRRLLHESFQPIEGEFAFAVFTDAQGADEIQKELDESVAGGCEGLMVKTLDKDSSYEPSKRSRNWLKVKKDYLKGIGDTLDLVVIGAYLGRGKRVGVYGGYLLACYEPDKEEYQTICKIGTGFSEEDLKTQFESLKEHVVSEPKPYYSYSDDPRVKPDVWFEPSMVWEVQCADLSVSPVHKAAAGEVDSTKGISLRFPRFMRIRDDKQPDDATTAEQHLITVVFARSGSGQESLDAIQEVLATVGGDKQAARRLVETIVPFLSPRQTATHDGLKDGAVDLEDHSYRQQVLACIRLLDALFTSSPIVAREIADSNTFWKAVKSLLRGKGGVHPSSGTEPALDVIGERLIAVVRNWMRSAEDGPTKLTVHRKESGLVMDRLVAPERVVIFSPSSGPKRNGVFSRDADASSIAASRSSTTTTPASSFIVPLNSVRSGVMELKVSMLVSEVDEVVRQADIAMRGNKSKAKIVASSDTTVASNTLSGLNFRPEDVSDEIQISEADATETMQVLEERTKDLNLRCAGMLDELSGNSSTLDYQCELITQFLREYV
ncbi:hypothetical protein HDU93_007108 [Gonapodya sp. JEL0774]|nr:hypothetical protein HDU93_007108 [Gonapodya sp. JEL0774]